VARLAAAQAALRYPMTTAKARPAKAKAPAKKKALRAAAAR
jgi:hypothetical protein